jgi:hypothetical protein
MKIRWASGDAARSEDPPLVLQVRVDVVVAQRDLHAESVDDRRTPTRQHKRHSYTFSHALSAATNFVVAWIASLNAIERGESQIASGSSASKRSPIRNLNMGITRRFRAAARMPLSRF